MSAAIVPNVWRYVQVAAESRWRVFLHSWCDTWLGCCFVYCRVGKNRDTRGSPRRKPGQAVPPTTKPYSLARKFSRYRAAIAYTDLLGIVAASIFFVQNREELTWVQINRFPCLRNKPLRIRWSGALVLSWGVIALQTWRVINVLFFSFNLSGGAVARLFEARGAACPPYGRVKCTSLNF